MLIQSVSELKKIVTKHKQNSKTIALVPTMGFLHEGHLSLIHEARTQSDIVITSVFVNPLQFGVGEDFEHYPRDMDSDVKKALSAGSNYVFSPSVSEFTPEDMQFSVNPGIMGDILCGKYRPGHFGGVCTIVLKLFLISQADLAFFGWKDAQQLLILKKMVTDLNLSIHLIGVETRRAQSGLALSSRNVYLSHDEKIIAAQIYRSLLKAKDAFENNPATDCRTLTTIITTHLESFEELRIQYVEIVSQNNLKTIEKPIAGNTLIALAVFIGNTRLIDNIRF